MCNVHTFVLAQSSSKPSSSCLGHCNSLSSSPSSEQRAVCSKQQHVRSTSIAKQNATSRSGAAVATLRCGPGWQQQQQQHDVPLLWCRQRLHPDRAGGRPAPTAPKPHQPPRPGHADPTASCRCACGFVLVLAPCCCARTAPLKLHSSQPIMQATRSSLWVAQCATCCWAVPPPWTSTCSRRRGCGS